MGAYSPAPIMNKELEEKTINKIIKPTIKGYERLWITLYWNIICWFND